MALYLELPLRQESCEQQVTSPAIVFQRLQVTLCFVMFILQIIDLIGGQQEWVF